MLPHKREEVAGYGPASRPQKTRLIGHLKLLAKEWLAAPLGRWSLVIARLIGCINIGVVILASSRFVPCRFGSNAKNVDKNYRPRCNCQLKENRSLLISIQWSRHRKKFELDLVLKLLKHHKKCLVKKYVFKHYDVIWLILKFRDFENK